jgi:AbrB family looped-hinge helix DNA binding protein
MTSQTIRVSASYQIVLPREACAKVCIKPGDRLIIDVQDDVLILTPEPSNYVERLAGLHREVWDGIDTTEYLDAERSASGEPETD